MLEGRSIEEKRALVKKVTDVVAETIHTERSAVRVLIYNMKRENWGTAGQLKCDAGLNISEVK